ncbi:MAG: hypothetical protein QM811_31960 [Pirellulales bacterium]
MRKTDHQLQQPLYIATWTKVNGKDVKFDQENTGYGWKARSQDGYLCRCTADFMPDEASGRFSPRGAAMKLRPHALFSDKK